MQSNTLFTSIINSIQFLDQQLDQESRRGPTVLKEYRQRLGEILNSTDSLRMEDSKDLADLHGRLDRLSNRLDALESTPESGKILSEADLKEFRLSYDYCMKTFEAATATSSLSSKNTLLGLGINNAQDQLKKLHNYVPTIDITFFQRQFSEILIDLEQLQQSTPSPMTPPTPSTETFPSSQLVHNTPVPPPLPNQLNSLKNALIKVFQTPDESGRIDIEILRYELLKVNLAMNSYQTNAATAELYAMTKRGLDFLDGPIFASRTIDQYISDMNKFKKDVEDAIIKSIPHANLTIHAEVMPGETHEISLGNWVDSFIHPFINRIENRTARVIVGFTHNELDRIQDEITQLQSCSFGQESRARLEAATTYRSELEKIVNLFARNNMPHEDRAVLLAKALNLSQTIEELRHQSPAGEADHSFYAIPSSSLPPYSSHNLQASSSSSSSALPDVKGRQRADIQPFLQRFDVQEFLRDSNAALRETINHHLFELPQPVDDRRVMSDIYSWTPGYMSLVLEGTIKAPTDLHLQAARFMQAQQKCQENREHEIIPHVYVGNYDALRAIDPREGANPKGYAQVISVTQMDPNSSSEFARADIPSLVKRVSVEVNDDVGAWNTLEGKFEELFEMIDLARATNQNILVHCSQGQSRSVTVLMAYLINRCRVTPEKALHFIRQSRFIAEPVVGLYEKLRAYARKLGITS